MACTVRHNQDSTTTFYAPPRNPSNVSQATDNSSNLETPPTQALPGRRGPPTIRRSSSNAHTSYRRFNHRNSGRRQQRVNRVINRLNNISASDNIGQPIILRGLYTSGRSFIKPSSDTQVVGCNNHLCLLETQSIQLTHQEIVTDPEDICILCDYLRRDPTGREIRCALHVANHQNTNPDTSIGNRNFHVLHEYYTENSVLHTISVVHNPDWDSNIEPYRGYRDCLPNHLTFLHQRQYTLCNQRTPIFPHQEGACATYLSDSDTTSSDDEDLFATSSTSALTQLSNSETN